MGLADDEELADYRKSKGSDIIQMLVSIYDTKDVFIKELQVLLAQRLLEIKDYDLERDVGLALHLKVLYGSRSLSFFKKRTVEILKLRFGESSLQVCEVMLKDLADSKRSDQNVHHSETTVSFSVLSGSVWFTYETCLALNLDREAGSRRQYTPPSYRGTSGQLFLMLL